MMHDGELMQGFGGGMFWPVIIELGVVVAGVLAVVYFVRRAGKNDK